MHLSLVMPCFNEADNVEAMHDAVEAAFAGCGFSYEMVFVDDGSKDDTYRKLRAIHARSARNVRLVRFSRNFGKEAAIFAGLRHAEGDLVTLIDADLQQPPSLALEMARWLDAHEEDDCVAAFQEKRSEGALTVFLKRGFYALMNRVTEIEFVQGASDFRTMRRSVVNAILELGEHNRFSKGIFSWVGFQTHYIPYVAEERHAGKSKFGTVKLFRLAFDGIVSFTAMPLRLAAVAGLLTALAALVYLIVALAQKLFFQMAFPASAAPVVLILLLGGLQLFCVGVLGEYLARAYAESRGRPIYVAKEIIEPKDK